MNEMIQEAVLDSIESIDDAQLFAEYEVLISLGATYLKSAMIQEAATGLEFDGFNVVQEADEPGVDVKTKKNGSYTSKNKQGFLSTILTWIKNAVSNIRKKLSKFFAKIFKKKGFAKYELGNVVANGGTVEFKTEEAAAKLGLPMKPTKADFTAANKAYGSAKGANYGGGVSGNATVISVNDVEVSFRLSFPMKGFTVVVEKIYNATKYLEEAAEAFWSHQNHQNALNSCKSAVKDIAKKTSMGFGIAVKGGARGSVENYATLVSLWKEADTKLTSCEKDVASVKKRMEHDKKYSDVALMGYAAAKAPKKEAFDEEKVRNADLQSFIDAANDVMAATKNMLNMSNALKAELDDIFSTGVKTNEWKSKASAAMDEADADERFGANAEFPG